ncbi:MAG: ParB N-terminal domain-containing protein, partial [Mycobacteriaceae bacterium]|nr:ParB N-terminal domain-containing protein [Mycobacteriaceae bacterium]
MTLDIAESSPAADTTDMLEHLLREPASLDPEVLLVDENVRETFDSTFESDPELIELLAAVREHGVKIPIIAELTADGGIGVVEGQLRTLAARKAGLDTIPAWVRRAPDLDDKTRKLARMTEQIVANDRRVALTNSDRAKAVALMLDLGMSVTKVSKAIQMKKVDVKPTAMIGKSPTARRLYDDHVLDLAQLSVIAEFENAGDTDAVTRLEQADARDFGSTAHLLRSERERAQARRAETDRYIEYGYRVLTDDDFPQADDDYVPVEDVRTLDGREVTPASTREHAASWAVYLEHLHDEDDVTDAETGLPVDPDAVDWNTREFPAAEAAQGMRHADTVNLSPFRPWFYIRPEDMTAADVTPAPSDADIKSDRTEPTAPAGRDGNFDDQPVADLVAPEDAVEGPDDIGEPDDPREARVEAEQLAAEQAARVEAARWEAQRQAAERREAERRAAARIDKLGEKAKAVNAARRDWLIDNIVA